MKPTNDGQSVSPKAYTEEYFRNHCEGYEEFLRSSGDDPSPRIKYSINLFDFYPGQTIVDIGCGRGELLRSVGSIGIKVIGLDYALTAINISRQTTKLTLGESKNIYLSLALATHLPLKNNSVDGVFMLDVVEHLYPYELKKALKEVYRVLKPGGTLIIHTMPNLWYYRFGYPLYKLVEQFRGHRLPSDPRDRFEYSHVHVNEQDPIKLFKYLSPLFTTKIWLKTIQNYNYENNPIIRFGMNLFTKLYPFILIFCNDIFAKATKPTK